VNDRMVILKAVIAFLLVAISAAILFVPVADGAEEVKAMFVMLTGIAVRDFFGAAQEDKRMAQLEQAYNPAPPESYVAGEEK